MGLAWWIVGHRFRTHRITMECHKAPSSTNLVSKNRARAPHGAAREGMRARVAGPARRER